MGVDFESKEREVIEKIILIEKEDMVQASKRKGKGGCLKKQPWRNWSLNKLLMKIVSWNIGGLWRIEKRKRVKEFLMHKKVYMVMFQETKRSGILEHFVKSLWPNDMVGFMTVDADDNVEATKIVSPFQEYEKEVMENFGQFKIQVPQAQCIGGDFNEVRTIAKRKGCTKRDGGMNEFNEFINDLEIVDVPMIGRKYTWCNSQEGERWSKLDGFLVNTEWLEWFSFKLWGLSRLLSDHCPIILMEDVRDLEPKPFRFLYIWVLHPTFMNLLKLVWENTHVDDWARFRLKTKLKSLKKALKVWNIKVFENVNFKLKEVDEEMQALDLVAEVRPLQDPELIRRREVKGEL
ncbi:uncharacterized protein LOC114318425 [Camellia sinensis]|uniref:uncharacterized protein LOC114318425 n=1 Tax=Camellia sinensis TaxID=4442 RepID=UPI0010367EB3|nr:uncharacterized protein LOC114318425 [Camellia sinensis]